MSALLYYVAIVVSTFIVPLADVEYISWSEIYKYLGVSIVVGGRGWRGWQGGGGGGWRDGGGGGGGGGGGDGGALL